MRKVIAGCVAVWLVLGAAPARAALPGQGDLGDLNNLLSTCNTLHPTGAGGISLSAYSYKFCDDGTPPFGGTTPNSAGISAIRVPAAYRYPDPVPAGVSDPTVDGLPPLDPNGPAKVSGADPVFKTVALDVDLTLPTTPAPPGGYPVIVMMHGCCSGNRHSWESGDRTTPGSFDDSGEKWHYNNVWFASRGYVVLTYTARGFVDGSNHGSTGETQIDSLQYEINDYQYLVGLLVDHAATDSSLPINPQKVVVTGGSYGGGFSWLAFTDPIWTSPGGKTVKLAAAAPKYGWTDLVHSLLPTGRHFYDFGSPPATDGSDSGVANGKPNVVAGIPIKSIIAALFLAGKTGIPPGSDHATFPQSVQDSFNCTQTFYPLELNPACTSSGAVTTLLPDFLRYRSAYYRNDFFARLAADPSYRTPVFNAGTHTDPLFPPVENHRMAQRLRATAPGYPIQEYYGDYQHFTQNKAKEWGDICQTGGSRHVCTSADFPSGDFNASPAGLQRTGVTTRLNRFIDFYAGPTGDSGQPQPAFDVTASLQVCPQNATGGQAGDEHGPTFTAPSYFDLTPGLLNLDLRGDQPTTSTAAPNAHAASSDPVANLVSNGGRCPVEHSPAGPGVATYDSGPLPVQATLIGGGIATVGFSATNATGLELNVRLYDVFPDGSAVMVDRGPRRVSADEAQRGSVQFQLHGNGWRFPAGHQIRLELAQDDDPYLKRSDVPSSSTVSRVQLQLPLRETTFGTKPSGAGGRAFAPTARMLAPRLASDSSTEPRFRIAWRGASFGSPLRAFQVQVQTTGAPRRRGHAARSWRTLSGLGATTRTSAMFRGRPGETYEFRVRARNTAGLASRYSSASTVVPLDELGAGARYRGRWHRQRSRGAWRGRVITCTARRCRVELRYRGGTLYLVGRTGPRGGLARVTLDGRSRTVSFYSRRVGQRQVVFSSRKTVRVHRLGVAVLHRKRRGGRGFEVAVDAFGLANLR